MRLVLRPFCGVILLTLFAADQASGQIEGLLVSKVLVEANKFVQRRLACHARDQTSQILEGFQVLESAIGGASGGYPDTELARAALDYRRRRNVFAVDEFVAVVAWLKDGARLVDVRSIPWPTGSVGDAERTAISAHGDGPPDRLWTVLRLFGFVNPKDIEEIFLEVAPCADGDGPCIAAVCQKVPRAQLSFAVEDDGTPSAAQTRRALSDALKTAPSGSR
jgi:hypothetical protein